MGRQELICVSRITNTLHMTCKLYTYPSFLLQMLLIKARLFLQFPIHSILSSRRQRSKSADHHSKSVCTLPSPLKHNTKRRSATRMCASWRFKRSCGHLGEITHTTKCKHRTENQKTPRKISDWVVSQNELKCIWETKTVGCPTGGRAGNNRARSN
jgi:hypothetical protein